MAQQQDFPAHLLTTSAEAGGLPFRFLYLLGRQSRSMVMIKTLLDRGFGSRITGARRSRRAAAGPVMFCLAVLAALPCQAQGTGLVQIDGRVDHMQVRLENAPIAQVLADLGRRFGLTYRRVPSINRPLTGRYSGTLNQVLARVLDGTDYILEVSDQNVTLVVLGVSAPPAARIGSNPVVSAVQNEPTPPAATPSDRAAPPAASASPSAGQVPPLSNFLPDNAQRPPRR